MVRAHNRRMYRLPLCLLLSATTALAASPEKPVPTPATGAPSASVPDERIPLEEIQRYVAVYRAIKQAYVEPLSDRQLMRAALRGLLLDLDPHSAYLEDDDAAVLDEQTSGSYVGIGIEVEQRPDRRVVVVAPIDGSPAARAGLRSGDVVLALDGKAIDAEHSDQVVQRLRGEAGTRIRLTLLRAGETAPREVTLMRAAIRINSVTSRLLEPGYGYLRLSTFQRDTGAQVTRQLEQLVLQSAGTLKGVVLDLRSNPGGVLNAAVEAADAFLDDGIIVSTRGRSVFSNSQYRAKPGDASAGAPLVVLIDAGTASAAEVLAGALHDQQRATLMGSRSFGKGSVQTIVPLDNGDSVKLTTARYFTPNGISIQASGIRPDIVLQGTANGELREQDLPRHLSGNHEVADGFAGGEVIEGEAAIAQALVQLKSIARANTAKPPARH